MPSILVVVGGRGEGGQLHEGTEKLIVSSAYRLYEKTAQPVKSKKSMGGAKWKPFS